jgi:hypothetical protein
VLPPTVKAGESEFGFIQRRSQQQALIGRDHS